MQGKTTKKAGTFCCGQEKAEGGAIKVHKIPKAGGKVKVELVFTRAHNNKMGKSTPFFTQMGVNFCNLSAQGMRRQTASVGSKRDKTIPGQEAHKQTPQGIGRDIPSDTCNPITAAAESTQGTETAGQPETPASG